MVDATEKENREADAVGRRTKEGREASSGSDLGFQENLTWGEGPARKGRKQ
jgi:hypothetical protein